MLQDENAIGLGYLLPTLTVILDKLDQLINPEDKPIRVTVPLTETIKNGLNNRFGENMNMLDVLMAAIVHPKFKLFRVKDDSVKARSIDQLK